MRKGTGPVRRKAHQGSFVGQEKGRKNLLEESLHMSFNPIIKYEEF
jgi:hypothetical protein